MEKELINLISDVGFPIILTIYLLTRFEKKIDILTCAINKLSNLISILSDKPIEEEGTSENCNTSFSPKNSNDLASNKY